MGDGTTVIGIISTPLAFMILATILNSQPQTQAILYTLIIIGAIAAGTIAGIRIASTDTSTVMIVFMETGLGALWAVMTASNLNYFSSLPTIDGISMWTPIYTIFSIMWIVAMLFAPRSIN